jgi:hypothetical protein
MWNSAILLHVLPEGGIFLPKYIIIMFLLFICTVELSYIVLSLCDLLGCDVVRNVVPTNSLQGTWFFVLRSIYLGYNNIAIQYDFPITRLF